MNSENSNIDFQATLQSDTDCGATSPSDTAEQDNDDSEDDSDTESP